MEEANDMDAPEVIENLEDLTLTSREGGYVPNRYTVPLRQGIDLQDLITGDGTMFETDLDNYESKLSMRRSQLQGSSWKVIPKSFSHSFHSIPGSGGGAGLLTPFKRLARGMEDLTGDGGVLKKILRPGTGPVVPKGATVRWHSNGYVEFDDEPFDSTRLRNRPYVTKIDEIVPGISVGISTMRKGELARFLLTPYYGFRELGCPPRVPPNVPVLYEVELLSYIDHKAAEDYDTFTEEERKQASFEQLLRVANSEREAGNDFYKRKQVNRAINKYLKAIKILEDCHLQNADQERWMNEVLLKIYLNAAHCSLELAQPARAIKYAKKAIGIDPRNAKALYRMGKAYMKEGEFDRSREWFKKAQRYEPNNKAINDALKDLEKKVEQFRSLEKERCKRMFAQPAAATNQDTWNGERSPLASGNLSDEKKEVLMKQLREFQEDDSKKEVCFPATLTKQERECIKLAAQE
ncbi:unnamed protein product, partial [Porites evermanni]